MAKKPADFDRLLADLPPAARRREWMLRIEAALFSASEAVPRTALAKLVGDDVSIDDLLADLATELRSRPYELTKVAGGWQLRTRPRFAEAVRRASGAGARDAAGPELGRTELVVLAAIAYSQPATRAQISRLAGKEVSRDTIAALKRRGFIDAGLRRAEPGAPFAYVTTKKFLAAFGLATLRDLPDLERFEDEAC